MDWIRHGVVVTVALAACGPSVGGDDGHGDPSESDTGGDPSATASATGGGSASTSGPSTSATATGESGSSTTWTDVTSDDFTGTATVTFTEDGPYPPEGGEIGESGECSCCGSSLHVVFGGGATDFSITLSSTSFAAFTVTCPAATVVGLDDAQIVCGAAEITIATDGFVDGFDEETWTATFGDSPFPVDAQSDCVYGGACDCNCVPTDCELFLPPDVDDG